MMAAINKKQVYIWDENLEFFEQAANKSKLINLLIKNYRASLENAE